MRVGSLFAGIGGFDLGLEKAGWHVRWQVEVDPRCIGVLKRHWPGVDRYHDIREVSADELAPVDLVCAGFPCQGVSVAGRRLGLRDPRSALFWEFTRVVQALRPRWVVLENVPGLLSSAGGRDMATVLWALEELGYGWAYRTLDSRYFGVAQRRRRVFIVGSLGDWAGASKVLFERQGRSWDTRPGRKTGQEAASGPPDGPGEACRVVSTLTAAGAGRGYRIGSDEAAGGHIVLCVQDARSLDKRQNGLGVSEDLSFTLSSVERHAVLDEGACAIRRLTPREWERLQCFPDDWTLLDNTGKPIADSHRYRMLGNAVTTSVAYWLGERLRRVHEGHDPDDSPVDLPGYVRWVRSLGAARCPA